MVPQQKKLRPGIQLKALSKPCFPNLPEDGDIIDVFLVGEKYIIIHTMQ